MNIIINCFSPKLPNCINIIINITFNFVWSCHYHAVPLPVPLPVPVAVQLASSKCFIIINFENSGEDRVSWSARSICFITFGPPQINAWALLGQTTYGNVPIRMGLPHITALGLSLCDLVARGLQLTSDNFSDATKIRKFYFLLTLRTFTIQII